MRHYLMHFWQQLPRHVTIFVSSMHSLDSHMYSLLEDIYLSNVDTQLDNLKRINTVAYLIPVWLKKTFEYVPFDGECWDLVQHRSAGETGKVNMNIGEIKVEEAEKWRWRIQFKCDFIVTLKVCEIVGTTWMWIWPKQNAIPGTSGYCHVSGRNMRWDTMETWTKFDFESHLDVTKT